MKYKVMGRGTAVKVLAVFLVWVVFLTMVLIIQLTLLESRAAQHWRWVVPGNSFGAVKWDLDPVVKLLLSTCACYPLHSPHHIFSHFKLCV